MPTVVDNDFTVNRATDRGGAVYTDTSRTVRNSTFAGNTADRFGGASMVGGRVGRGRQQHVPREHRGGQRRRR